MLCRFFRSGHLALCIQMPAHRLAAMFHLHGKITVQPAINYRVVADGPIAIQAQAREVNHQRVSRRSSLNVEGSSFRISTEYAGHAFFVGAASVDGGGVNGVTG